MLSERKREVKKHDDASENFITATPICKHIKCISQMQISQ